MDALSGERRSAPAVRDAIARGREVSISIAACAACAGASVWTLNPRDFEDCGIEVIAG